LIIVAASWLIAGAVSYDIWFQGKLSLAFVHHLRQGVVLFR